MDSGIKSLAIEELANCMSDENIEDETIDLLTDFINYIETIENPNIFNQVYNIMKYLCRDNKYTLDNTDVKFIFNITKNGNDSDFTWAGNKIHTLHKYVYPVLNGCITKISDKAKTRIKEILLSTNFKTNIDQEKIFLKNKIVEDLNELCNNVFEQISLEDIPKNIKQDFILDTLFNSNKYYVDILMRNKIRCVSKQNENIIKEMLILILDNNVPNSYKTVKLLLRKFKDFCINISDKVLPSDFIPIFKKFLQVYNPLEFESQIHSFFEDITMMVNLENIPRYISSAKDNRFIIENEGIIDNEYIEELNGINRNIRTLKKLEPTRNAVRPQLIGDWEIPDLLQDEIRSSELSKNISGRVYNPIKGGNRLLIRTNSNEDLSWSGYYHPFVIEDNTYFECGMGCNDRRSKQDNEKIRDSCLVQKQRRGGGNITRKLEDEINICNKLISNKRVRRFSKKLKRFKNNKKISKKSKRFSKKR